MKKQNLFKVVLLIVLSVTFRFSFAQVGIGELNPNSKLDIVNSEATGNGIEVTHDNGANGSSAAWIKNSGLGYTIHAQTLNTSNNNATIRALQFGQNTNSIGLLVDMRISTIAPGISINQGGLGIGQRISMNDVLSTNAGLVINQTGLGDAIYNNIIGDGWGIYNNVQGNGGGIWNTLDNNGVASASDIHTSGGIGYYALLETGNGTGIYINAVDNTASPTTGGDVLGFNANVFTQTPTISGIISGAVLTGNQYGVGHGILLNHSGTQGINAEFNSTNIANTNSTIQTINSGQGSAIVGKNDNNVITGTLAVADFAYIGTDVTDHRGVSGYSLPAAGWGIGVLGQGGWYGTFSIGNSGSTGVKTFTIDHPKDPENKILRHFSIESNEVLNIYRGTAVFNNNGSVVVTLPDYYHSINKNASYQLTPIGASMPNIFIKKEINNGQFIISGGVANKKVSWIVTAERNDPYLQQQPENRKVIIEKEGARKGKYLTPELYNQPKEKGMFYNKNNQNLEPSKIKKQNIILKKPLKKELPTPNKKINN